MESGTAGDVAKAVLRRAPTVILRPAMGVSMAVGQTLMGATNSLDPSNRRRVEDVSRPLLVNLWIAKMTTEIQKALTLASIKTEVFMGHQFDQHSDGELAE